MTDKEKLEKLRAEIERLMSYCPEHGSFGEKILNFIDSMQEDPCNGCTNRKGCVTCENGELRETVQEESTGNIEAYQSRWGKSNGYLAEPVSEKKCMFTGDNYTDEDRNVLCEGCEAECKYSKQSVDEAMAEIEEKAKAFTKAHKGESADEILSEMRGKEPVSDDFKLFEKEYLEKEEDEILCVYDRHAGLVDGAQWQKEQFEKNRLKHCNSITNEQAELEQGFIDQHLDKYQRMPTFLDAIEYGMRLQKQQMMKNAVEEIVDIDSNGLACINIDGYLPGDKIKIYIFKEE